MNRSAKIDKANEFLLGLVRDQNNKVSILQTMPILCQVDIMSNYPTQISNGIVEPVPSQLLL